MADCNVQQFIDESGCLDCLNGRQLEMLRAKILCDLLTEFQAFIASGSFNVTGPLTDAQLRASDVGVETKIYDENTATYKGLLFNAGSPQICSQDYLQALAEGDISNHTPWVKIGYNPDIDNAEETVWGVGGTYTFPVSAQQMEVYSANANDTNGGTGINKVRIGYLDTNYVSKSEIVTLNGGVVATAATDILRVNSFRAYSAGTGGVAAGNIDVRHLSDTPVYSRIMTGNTRARNSVYTVPSGQTLYITSVSVGAWAATAGKLGRFTLRATYDDVSAVTGIFFPHFEVEIVDASFYRPFELPIKLPARTDLYMTCISDGVSSNLVAQTTLRGWLE